MHVCAIDVGYSGLKIAAGARGEAPQLIVRPSGAAPADRVAHAVRDGEGDPPVGVTIDGRRWLAALDPLRYDGWSRSLHEDYTTTPAYRALATAAMMLQSEATGRTTIDVLVTGLPVSQALEVQRVQALESLFRGHHHAEGFAPVRVDEVAVIAQPLGAYLDLITSTMDDDILERADEGTVLVLDPGYYSTDWALISRGELRTSASGTSIEGMSVVVDRAATAMAGEFGGRAQGALLEAALRRGRATLLQSGRRVEVAPFLRGAIAETAPVVIEALKESQRREHLSVDLVLLAGGGGTWFEEVISSVLDGARVVVADDPITANVKGFFARG